MNQKTNRNKNKNNSNLKTEILAWNAQGVKTKKHEPSKWKEGRILLFPKSGKDLRHPENYRPITLLNTMGKMAEKIICKRLKQNLGNTIRAEQFGFRANHSSTAQLMRHVE